MHHLLLIVCYMPVVRTVIVVVLFTCKKGSPGYNSACKILWSHSLQYISPIMQINQLGLGINTRVDLG